MFRRRLDDEAGFSLVELTVVVLIIAILIAIAIPTFLGSRRRSQDAQAKTVLRAALIAEKTYAAEKQSYTSDIPALQQLEGALAWGSLDAAIGGVVVEDISPNSLGVVLASESRSGTRFCLADLHESFNYAGYFLTEAGSYYSKREDPPPDHCHSLVWKDSNAGWD